MLASLDYLLYKIEKRERGKRSTQNGLYVEEERKRKELLYFLSPHLSRSLCINRIISDKIFSRHQQNRTIFPSRRNRGVQVVWSSLTNLLRKKTWRLFWLMISSYDTLELEQMLHVKHKKTQMDTCTCACWLHTYWMIRERERGRERKRRIGCSYYQHE